MVVKEIEKILKVKINEPGNVYQFILLSLSPSTTKHSLSTAYNCALLAQENNLDQKSYEILIRTALFHDIGKIYVPEHILHGQELTKEEFKIIKRHPRDSFYILNTIGYSQEARIAVAHHELGRKPYSRERQLMENTTERRKTMASEKLRSLEMLVIADVYDALINDRPYREENFKPEDAINIMYNNYNVPLNMIDNMLELYFKKQKDIKEFDEITQYFLCSNL